ncbi:MAG: hydrogen peroxide-inducible genes activator [Magnetococcus sp. WYHC-3]
MNFTQLKYALAVARTRNFSQAAKLCRISQPSLSVAVKNLEEELGVSLFERIRNDVKITPVGARILAQAQKALEEVDRIRGVAQDGSDPLTGSLRLGAILTVGPYLFPSLVPAFHQRAPAMTLMLEEGYTQVLTERLRQGELDAIVIAMPFDEPAVKVQVLYHEPFVAAVPSGHPWCGRRDLTGAELAGERLLLLGEGNCFRDQVLEICPDGMRVENTVGRDNILEGSSLETLRHMVATGAGTTVLPLTAVNSLICNMSACPARENHLLQYVPFSDPVPERRVALAWRTSYPNHAAIEALIQSVRSAPPPGGEPFPRMIISSLR